MYDVIYEIIQLLHLSGLSALDSARCPLRSRSATSRSSELYHARSRSIDFRPDPLRFPLRSHAVVTNSIEQSS